MARTLLPLALAALTLVPSLAAGIDPAAPPTLPPADDLPAAAREAARLDYAARDVDDMACLGEVEHVPAQGPSCRVAVGWKVFLGDGSTLLTHGPDTFDGKPPRVDAPSPEGLFAGVQGPFGAGPESLTLLTTPKDVVCVNNPTAHAGLVIYAAPLGQSLYATRANQLRDLVEKANGILNEDGMARGADVNYRMRCDVTGQIRVDEAQLPLTNPTDFASVVTELKALGYTSPYEKYWIWWEGGNGNVAGEGEISLDDRPGVENFNNRGPSYAVTWGTLSVRVMMHENGHNLGAVQLTTPNASGGMHCNDGKDIMCYADGGSSSQYTEAKCPDRERFDCLGDDYFNPNPTGWLADHWNLGSQNNRWFDFCGGPLAGAGHDVGACGLSAPLWTRPAETITLTASVRNNAATAESNVRVALTDDGVLVGETFVNLSAFQAMDVAFDWTPVGEREHALRLAVGPVAGDTNSDNDARTAKVRVVTPAGNVRVAVFDSPGTDHTIWFGYGRLVDRWFEFGDRTIELDRVSLNRVNVTLADLRAVDADVIVIPDANSGNPAWLLTADEGAALEEFIQEGHGLFVTHGTLARGTSANNVLLPLLGLTGSGGTACALPTGKRAIMWEGSETGLRQNVATPYVTGVECGISPPLSPAGASRAATSADNYFQAYTYRHKAAGIGAGAGVFVSWEPHVTGYGANRDDLQVAYNAYVWLADASAPLAVDRGLARVEVPPTVCQGHPYTVRAVARNFGTSTSGATTARVLVDGAVAHTWSLGALAGGAEVPLAVTLPAPASGTTHTVTLDVTGTGDGATGNNVKSRTFTLQACSPPGAPVGLDAYAGPGAGEVTLKWVPATQTGGAAVTHYQVLRSTGGGTETVVARLPAAAGLTHRDAGLAAGTTYQYRVAAENGAGAGRPSIAASATTFDGALPGQPALRVTQGHEQMILDITPAAVPGAQPPTAYRIYRAEAGVETLVRTLTGATTWTDHFHMDGKVYTYRVVPVNGAGDGPSSASVTARVHRGFAATSAVWRGDDALLFGGWTGQAERRILRHDPGTGLYTFETAQLPTARYGTSAVWDARSTTACPQGCAYVFGGFNATHVALRDVLRYDPVGGTVTQVALLPTGRGATSAVWDAATSTAYVFGGTTGGSTYTDQVVAFQPDTASVTVKAAKFSTPTTSTSAVWTGGKALVFGGWNGVSLDAIREYDPAADTLTTLTAKLPWPRSLTSATYDDTHAYVFGGYDSDDIVRFTPATGAVTTMTQSLPTPRHYTSAVWDGERSVTFGGDLGSYGGFSAFAFTYAIAPAAPGALTRTVDPATQSVSLSWGTPSAASHNVLTAFEVHRGPSAGRETLVATLPGTARSYVDTGVAPGTTAYYRVLAVNEGRDRGAASTIAASMPNTPLPPGDVAATRGPGLEQVLVTWNLPADDGGATTTAYRLYRAPSGGSESLVAELSATVPINRITNPGFESGTSGWTTIGTSCTHSVVTTWSTEGTRSRYVRDTSATAACGTFQNVVATAGKTYTLTGKVRLDAGAVAIRMIFRSPNMLLAEHSQTFTTAGIHDAMLSVVAPAGTTRVEVWPLYVATSATGEAYADAMLLSDGGTTNRLSYQDAGLASGTTYAYRMTSVNVIGEGPSSPTASATTYANTPPDAPQGLTVQRGGSGVLTLAWQPPADNGSPATTGYRVYRGTSAGALTQVATLGNVLTWTDAGRTNGVTYHYAVTAVNSVGEGAQSSTASETAARPPDAPTNLNACSGDGNVYLSWTAPADTGGLAVTGYTLSRRTLLTDPVSIPLGNVTAYTDAGLSPGTKYYYTVAAVTPAGQGAASAEQGATVVTDNVQVVCNT